MVVPKRRDPHAECIVQNLKNPAQDAAAFKHLHASLGPNQNSNLCFTCSTVFPR